MNIFLLGRIAPQRSAMAQALMAAIGFSLATGIVVWLTGQFYGALHGLVFLPMAVMGGLALLTVRPLARATRR